MTSTTPQPGGMAASAAGTMRAIVQDTYGTAPEAVLRVADVARPTVGDDDVLVRVAASSVDRGTWHLMAGLPYPVRLAGFGVRAPKTNPGRSLAGTVEAIGANVSGFAVGDEVYGITNGTFAEYALVSPAKLALKPATISWEQAAAAPISGLTALQAVRDHAKVQAGQRVLIIGASGGVGSFAVQIAKVFGAEVTAVSSTAKVDLVRSLGADHVIDYSRQGIGDGGARYDVVLDMGGNTSLSQLRRVLSKDGTLVIVGGETDGRLLGGSGRQIRATMLSMVVSQKLGTFINSENAADLRALAELMAAGTVTSAVERTYPLDQTVAAIRHLMDGKTKGKVTITL
jgi:NADPH:quinone reductase-like Zn-dependent oxidoreductase